LSDEPSPAAADRRKIKEKTTSRLFFPSIIFFLSCCCFEGFPFYTYENMISTHTPAQQHKQVFFLFSYFIIIVLRQFDGKEK
jgi:hypothetical protein